MNGRVERFGSTRLNKGDEVVIWPSKRPLLAREEARVLYEDDDLLVYNKPPSISSSDLAAILNVHLVHRLDRDTTGVILFAKKDPTPYEDLFRQRKIKKTYHALVRGVPKEKRGTITAYMGRVGKREGAVVWGIVPKGLFSKTVWECEKQGKQWALMRCHPETGRTHQIRVHLKELGHPVLGDSEYGDRKGHTGVFRPMLHATSLEFDTHHFYAPLPTDFLVPAT